MDSKHGIEISTRDKVLRAWENSMELVRDFEEYSQEIQDDSHVAKMFAAFAEEEGMHASKFKDVLNEYQRRST